MNWFSKSVKKTEAGPVWVAFQHRDDSNKTIVRYCFWVPPWHCEAGLEGVYDTYAWAYVEMPKAPVMQ